MIQCYWLGAIIPWLRFLFLSCKPVGQPDDDDHENDQKSRPHDGEDDYDLEAHVPRNSFARDAHSDCDSSSSLSASQKGHSLSDTCFQSPGDQSSHQHPLTIQRCRFEDISQYCSPLPTSTSSPGQPRNQSFLYYENEIVVSTPLSPAFKNKPESQSTMKKSASYPVSKLRKLRASFLYRNRNLHQNQENCLHPVMKILREQELAKHILGLAIPMTMGLMAYYNPLAMTLATRLAFVLLSISFAALWNGNLLRETYPGFSHKIELLGYVCMLTAFYSLVAYFLKHTYLALFPVICLLLSLVPLGMAFYNRNSAPAGS